MPTIARISVAPVKNTRLSHPDEVTLGPEGVLENRRFFLVDADGARLRTSQTAWPSVVQAAYDATAELLSFAFPDGTEVEGDARPNGDVLVCRSAGQEIPVRVVDGPWAEPLAQLGGRPVRLVRTEVVGASLTEPVTLVSDGSLARLAEEAGVDRIDARRFRMLFELAGCEPHEEDGWEGHRLEVGEALLEVGGPVERCAATTRDPDTGVRDLDTLRLIKAYRGQREPDGAILFGVYGRVLRPGTVRVGDPVRLR